MKESLDSIKGLLSLHFPHIEIDRIAESDCQQIFHISSSGQDYILKLHAPWISRNIASLEMIYRTCAEQDITPEIILSKKKTLIVRHENKLISLQKKVTAIENHIDPYILGEHLARLHLALRSLQISQLKNHLQDTVQDLLSLSTRYGYGKLNTTIQKVLDISKGSDSQVIHGDLHSYNIIKAEDHVYFIDFDSANFFHPMSDIAFSGFRFFGFDENKIARYIEAYKHHTGENHIDRDAFWHFVIYNITQRILFILVENEKGNEHFLIDMPNQKRYLWDVLDYCALSL
jgi:Ser/Thr protein kinase RdoA (MazF antagonist)